MQKFKAFKKDADACAALLKKKKKTDAAAILRRVSGIPRRLLEFGGALTWRNGWLTTGKRGTKGTLPPCSTSARPRAARRSSNDSPSRRASDVSTTADPSGVANLPRRTLPQQ